jgi:hypothetical protein
LILIKPMLLAFAMRALHACVLETHRQGRRYEQERGRCRDADRSRTKPSDDHPIVVAHTAPPARSITPAMNIAVSSRVISQLPRMARLNCWTNSE